MSQNIKKRMIVLCTSYKQIQSLKNFAKKYDKELGGKVIFQDSISSKKVLLNKYLNNVDSILIGTNTFWEGLDLPKDKLEILLIIKIPFSNPYNPIVKSKIDYLSSLGLNSFLDYQLPESILKLKQGIGRLIRRCLLIMLLINLLMNLLIDLLINLRINLLINLLIKLLIDLLIDLLIKLLISLLVNLLVNLLF